MSILYRPRTGALAGVVPLILAAATAIATAQTPSPRAGEHRQFVENRGQWSQPARYLSRHAGLDVWITDVATIAFDHYRIDNGHRRGHVIRMHVAGAAASAPLGVEPSGTTFNYFTGSTSVAGAPGFARVHAPGVLPGVDLVVYTDAGLPRYDILVAPGADPRDIRLQFDGATRIAISGSDLVLSTELGDIRQSGLVAYQMVDGQKRRVPCSFRLEQGGTVGFQIGDYDRGRPLVIDPIVYSTFLGGNSADLPNSLVVDASGNAYIVGVTASPDFPFISGSYFASLRGATDAFVTKLSADGSTLEYSTYLGGTSDDGATAVVTGPLYSVYVAGYTTSRDFPVRLGAVDTTYNGDEDAFLVRLDSAGRTLGYSSYIGGPGMDRPTALAIDRANRPYMAGYTASGAFPTTIGAYQTRLNGVDGFVMKLDTGARRIITSTFIGGGADERITDLAIRGDTAYVAGWTQSDAMASPLFPTTSGALQTSFGGGTTDGFVVVLDPTMSSAVYATLLGGADLDEINALAVEPNGTVAVTGRTLSTDFPVTASALQSSVRGEDAFVAKITPSGSGLRYSTYYGGTAIDAGEEIALTREGRVLVAGRTTSSDLAMTGTGMLSQALGGTDIFILELGDTSSALIYTSYLGGTQDDSVTSLAFDGRSVLHLAGMTTSRDFPTTPGAFDQTPNGGDEGFILRAELVQVLSPNGGEQLCAGEPQTITWTGGNVANYEVSVSANGGLTWTPVGIGVSGNSFSWIVPAAQPPGDLYRFRVRVTGSSEGDVSDTVLSLRTPPSVSQHPVSQLRSEGRSVQFSASAVGSAPIEQQWQGSVDGGVTWQDLSGDTASTLILTPVNRPMDSMMFRARFVNACDTVYSRPARLTVAWLNLAGPLGGETFCAGDAIPITWTSGNIDRVTVLISSDGGSNWSVIDSNVPGTSYLWQTSPTQRAGTRYRVRLIQGGTSEPTSSTAVGEFAIHTSAEIIDDPDNVTTRPGTAATFSIAANGYPTVTYQWQVQPPGGGWSDVPDATGASIFVGDLTLAQNGTRYRAIASSACGADTSAEATLTVTTDLGVDDEGTTGSLSATVQPRPASGPADLILSLVRAGDVTVTIVDGRGSVVSRIDVGRREPGSHRLAIETGGIPAGIYQCLVRVGLEAVSTELVVVR